MKKIVNILAFGICLVLLASFGISSLAASVNATSPNYGYVKEAGDNQLYGFVQIKPSYNEAGMHAQVGVLHFFGSYIADFYEAEKASTKYQDTYKYTTVGTSQNDSRTLTRSYTYTFQNPKPGQYIHGKRSFMWQPHTSNNIPWANPLVNSPIADAS